MDLSVLWKISYGLYVAGVEDGKRPAGCIVNALTQITSEDPIFALSINKDNYTYEVMERTKRFSISILDEEADPLVISVMGFSSGRNTDKFADIDYEWKNSLPIIKNGCCGYLFFDVLSMVECETHFVVLARLTDTAKGSDAAPMTYEYYHSVIKGKAPKNAPTYRDESDVNKGKWVCSVCGYVFEGDLTKMPDSFTCPICSVGKDKFVLQK